MASFALTDGIMRSEDACKLSWQTYLVVHALMAGFACHMRPQIVCQYLHDTMMLFYVYQHMQSCYNPKVHSLCIFRTERKGCTWIWGNCCVRILIVALIILLRGICTVQHPVSGVSEATAYKIGARLLLLHAVTQALPLSMLLTHN